MNRKRMLVICTLLLALSIGQSSTWGSRANAATLAPERALRYRIMKLPRMISFWKHWAHPRMSNCMKRYITVKPWQILHKPIKGRTGCC